MTTHKQKRITRRDAKRRNSAKRRRKRSETFGITLGRPRFRLLAFQPLSLALDDSRPFELSIQKIPCRFALQPVHSDPAVQRVQGGTFVAIEFSLKNVTDMLVATQKGLNLIEDFLSGVSLVEGTTFRDVEPVQIVSTEQEPEKKYKLIRFLPLSMHHWDRPISNDTIETVRGLLAHWDGLDSGKRMRRAARQYHKAIGTDNDLAAFQHAYMGLEALEKPLADVMNIPPGVEELRGQCDKCGAEYIRKRTVLAGVRAYVCGALHPETAPSERRQEWKEINNLRQELFHSLKDSTKLEQEARRVGPAAMHHLHDAICCLSHAHSLESNNFKLVRGIRRILLLGRFRSSDLGLLDQWRPLLDVEDGYWVNHPQYGFIPEFRINNPGIKDLEAVFFWLNAPLKSATEDNLIPANFENKGPDHGSDT